MWGRRHFYFGDSISVGVKDVARAIAWYSDKLGLLRSGVKSDEYDELLTLNKSDEVGVALVAISPGESSANVEGHPILFTSNIEAAHKDFAVREIAVSPIEKDSGGNQFFRFRDLEGNEIEVCVEPG